MKMRYAPLVLFLVCSMSLIPSLWAQEEDEDLAQARDQYKEVQALREKTEMYMNEMVAMEQERQTAEPDRQKELESELMLKERAYQRMGSTTNEKEKSLFDLINSLLPKYPDSVELRQMRFECAYMLERFDVVLEDVVHIPKEKHDTNFMMIWAKALEATYRFKEAAGIYKKSMDQLDENQKLYVKDRLGFCYFNSMDFLKAKDCFSELAAVAPAYRKQQMDQLVVNAGMHVKLWENELELCAAQKEKDDNPLILLQLDKGEVTLELFEAEAPNTVANFISLVEKGFYDGLKIHRVVPQFMIQGGDPEGTGRGGPGYTFADECRKLDARRHFVGTLSMANSGPNTNGSQFFITTVVAWWLDGKHTVFGRVLEGQDAVNRTEQNDLIIKAKVLRKRDHEYVVKKL